MKIMLTPAKNNEFQLFQTPLNLHVLLAWNRFLMELNPKMVVKSPIRKGFLKNYVNKTLIKVFNVNLSNIQCRIWAPN